MQSGSKDTILAVGGGSGDKALFLLTREHQNNGRLWHPAWESLPSWRDKGKEKTSRHEACQGGLCAFVKCFVCKSGSSICVWEVWEQRTSTWSHMRTLRVSTWRRQEPPPPHNNHPAFTLLTLGSAVACRDRPLHQKEAGLSGEGLGWTLIQHRSSSTGFHSHSNATKPVS